MSQHRRDRTYTEARLPRGIALVIALGIGLIIGVYLIVSGLA